MIEFFILTPSILFNTTLLCCTYMTGLIWFVQVVHYPLFKSIPKNSIKTYATLHANRTTFVVIAPMLLELGTAFILLFTRPLYFSIESSYLSFALILLIFLSTFLLQVPDHEKIQESGQDSDIEHLVKWNWIRTIAWSLRLVCILLH